MSTLQSKYRHRATGDVGMVTAYELHSDQEVTIVLSGLAPGTEDTDPSLHVFPVRQEMIEIHHDPIISNNAPPEFIPGRPSLGTITLFGGELDDATVWERLPDTP